MSAEPCKKCGKTIRAQKPVFLYFTGRGKIEGPYHPACAYFVTIESDYYSSSARVVVANDAHQAARIGEST